MTPTVICRSFRFSFRPALALNIQTHVLCLLTLTSVDVWMCLTSDGPHRGKVGCLHEQSRTPFSGPTRSCDVGRPLERKKSKAAFMMEEEWRRKLEAEARRQLDEERQLASHDMAIPVERVTSLS